MAGTKLRSRILTRQFSFGLGTLKSWSTHLVNFLLLIEVCLCIHVADFKRLTLCLESADLGFLPCLYHFLSCIHLKIHPDHTTLWLLLVPLAEIACTCCTMMNPWSLAHINDFFYPWTELKRLQCDATLVQRQGVVASNKMKITSMQLQTYGVVLAFLSFNGLATRAQQTGLLNLTPTQLAFPTVACLDKLLRWWIIR